MRAAAAAHPLEQARPLPFAIQNGRFAVIDRLAR